MEKVFEIYIKTTPERLWAAITDPAQRAKYNFGASVTSDWKPGSRYTMGARNGTVMPRRRRDSRGRSSSAAGADDGARCGTRRSRSEGTSRVTWEIEPVGDSCCLTVTHDQLREGANDQLYGGWPMILSGLKTWLETGEMLTTPGSIANATA